jgi:hypothetical protein
MQNYMKIFDFQMFLYNWINQVFATCFIDAKDDCP